MCIYYIVYLHIFAYYDNLCNVSKTVVIFQPGSEYILSVGCIQRSVINCLSRYKTPYQTSWRIQRDQGSSWGLSTTGWRRKLSGRHRSSRSGRRRSECWRKRKPRRERETPRDIPGVETKVWSVTLLLCTWKYIRHKTYLLFCYTNIPTLLATWVNVGGSGWIVYWRTLQYWICIILYCQSSSHV